MRHLLLERFQLRRRCSRSRSGSRDVRKYRMHSRKRRHEYRSRSRDHGRNYSRGQSSDRGRRRHRDRRRRRHRDRRRDSLGREKKRHKQRSRSQSRSRSRSRGHESYYWEYLHNDDGRFDIVRRYMTRFTVTEIHDIVTEGCFLWPPPEYWTYIDRDS